ncbi:MAG TPA: hypothetical protein VG815_19345 [Chloroflexota bacterium]|jgi:hypothetical protein|nr:hypothetical protein [Chloroflexota bacterium]
MTTQVILILLASKVVVLIVAGAIFWKVMGPELRAPRPRYGIPGVRCVYCHATPSVLHSEEQRWEEDELVMVRTYECRECHMPFWRVERVQAVTKTSV